MPFEPMDDSFSRKRKRDFPVKKLQINERVEVRSLDVGFQGSWHPGTVINCGKLKRLVRYENILVDDGSGHLVEEVNVSDALDGVVRSSNCNYRGLIRPPPPLIEFEKCDLKFGLCVDVQYHEAWWEGVIFDHSDGMEERSVFFPDLGDEMNIGIRQMRITQDWDEVTEKWRKRGSWVFLELIEECQRECYVGVSIKQIWFDVREKKDFGMIGDWTLGVKGLWKEMVMEVVNDYLTLTVKEISSHLSIPEQSSELMSNVDLDTTFLGKEICARREPVLPVKEDLPKFQNENSCNGAGAICFEKHEHRSSTYLSPIYRKPQVLSETDYCPEAVIQYALASEKRLKTPWKEKVRKHLLYLGWKIDCSENKLGAKHFKYKSPNEQGEKVYISLIEVCQVMQKEYTMNSSSLSKNDLNIMHLTNDCHDPNALLNPSEKIQDVNSSPLVEPPRAVTVVDEQDYCPQAVVEYYASHIFMKNRAEKKKWISKAKNHLLADGWTFDDPPPDNRKRGIIYITPRNRRFSTLHAACRFCIEQSISQWTISGRLPFNVSTINQENVDKVLSDDLLHRVAQMLPREHELHTPDSVPANRSAENRKRKHLSDASLHKVAQMLPKEPELHTTDSVAANGSYENQKHKHFRDALLHKVAQVLPMEPELRTTDSVAANRSIENRQQKHLSDALLHGVVAQMLQKESKLLTTDSVAANRSTENLKQKHSTDDLLHGVAEMIPKEPELHTTHRIAANRSTENRKRKRLRSSKGSLLKHQSKGLSPRVLRSYKRVQEVSVPCMSHQKPLGVLSWLIDSNMVLPRTKVFCCGKRHNRVVGEGRITRDGIKCNCCLRAYSIGGFEFHASRTNTDRPSANIFLEDGRSLLECQIQLMQDHKTRSTMETPMNDLCQGENDYVCSICHYGGELILCDQCPSSFHKTCLRLEDIPDGDWFCPSCRCGICGQSRINGDEDGHFLTCYQCEHKYHVTCMEKKDIGKSKRYGENWFCGKDCEKIYDGLQKLLGEPVSVGVDNLTWTLMKFTDSQSRDLDSTNKTHLLAESYSKLNVAISMMHECFEPLKESSSSRDLMEDVIFSRWSKLSRLNFRGFYTVLLERNEELVSVATIRVYGEKVAEVPLIGTRLQYRRHGMCRILMNELEKKLKQLGVERLVLPAVPSVLDTWTGSFGFSKMTIIERSEFLDYSFLDFQDTIMCQKLLTNTLSTKIPSPDSVLPKEFLGNCSTDTDKSSPASEDYQAIVVDKREMLDQQMETSNTDDGNKDQLDSDVMDSVTMVKQPSHENQQCQNGTSQQCSFGKWNSSFKYYKRRKVKKHEV